MSSFLLKKEEKKTFQEKISKLSRKTQENIMAVTRSFEKFCVEEYEGRTSVEIFNELKILKDTDKVDATRQVLQNWIDWLYQNNILTSTIHQYISKIKKLFFHNGIRVHLEEFPEPLEFKPKIKEELHQLTIEEIQNILNYANPKKLSFYLALISTGARPSELLQVRKQDVDLSKKRVKIRIEAENSKTRSGRSVFLTREAARPLLTRLRKIERNGLVWGTHENFSFSEKNESTQFSKVCDKAGYSDRYKSNGFRKITLYSFRSFFFGKAADIHREGYAHKMTGHGGYLPQYDRMSDEKKLDWFIEVEPELTVFDEERERIKNTQLSEENSRLRKKQSEIQFLEKRIGEIEKEKEKSVQSVAGVLNNEILKREISLKALMERMEYMAKEIRDLKFKEKSKK